MSKSPPAPPPPVAPNAEAADRGVDFTQPQALESLAQGCSLRGTVGEHDAIMVRQGDAVYVLGAHCTHAGAPLHRGCVTGHTVRCPWHHASFALDDGRVTAAPALRPLDAFEVVVRDGQVRATGKKLPRKAAAPRAAAQTMVIVGAGAAGDAAAATLREAGFAGTLHLLSQDPRPAYDRTKLSKNYLSGEAKPDALPLRPQDFYRQQRIEMHTAVAVHSLQPQEHTVRLTSGRTLSYDRLLLATGAEPQRPPIPGSTLPHVHVLRSVEDCEGLRDQAVPGAQVVIVGAGFIGLEAAAGLRKRGCSVHVVAPWAVPLANVLGETLGRVLQDMHAQKGVVFHLGRSVVAIEAPAQVVLDDGSRLRADLVLLAVGVKPRLHLAQQAGLQVDGGVVVDAQLRSSAADVYAAGDIAQFVAAYSGESMRVEHWAVAQQMGACAAQAMLGSMQPYTAVPFFWTRHYDVSLAYVGHTQGFDATDVYGDLAAKQGAVVYKKAGRPLAVATLGWQTQSLACEVALEKKQFGAIENILSRA
jgi:NADPH-dependent 2,4-dienoyl-CoA reductase/sulfur reductase-like enzyme/nitrite reductase/ring-hydroxylating ferredoxin subunit